MGQVEIREATVADILGIKEIYSSWMDGEDQISFFMNLVIQSINDPKAEEWYFVAVQQDSIPIGIVGYRTTPIYILATFADTKKQLQVTALMVHKNFTNKGVGSALLSYIEHFASKNDYLEVLLTSSERWKNSWSFYKKFGYCDKGEVPNTHEWHTKVFSKLVR